MEVFENINTIVSIIAGLLSVIMFFLAKKEKDKCANIRDQIYQQISNETSTIKSSDKFKIEKVQVFDNRKSIK